MPIPDFLGELRTAPEPLTRAQRWLFAALFAVVIATRFAALSQSLADWDEALFCAGVRDYDVAVDHPHAPGYPLFVGAAKLVRPFVASDFIALRTIVLLCAVGLFPATFLFARELRLRNDVALLAATLLLFLPTLWYFGGTALSDVPALTLTLLACALLLRGARDPRMFLLGMFAGGLAASIRAHSVMVIAVAGLVAFAAMRSLRVFLGGCAIAAAVSFAAYGTAALNSDDPPHGYWARVQLSAEHVRSHDSFRNPARPPLTELASPFLVKPFRGGKTGLIVFGFAIAGLLVTLVRRTRLALLILALFLPMALFTWLMLDMTSATRYAIAYLPMYALFAALGIAELAASNRIAMSVVGIVVVAMFIRWTYPTLRVLATTDAPLVAAFDWVRKSVPPDAKLYVDNDFELHADYLMRGREYTLVWEEKIIRREDYRRGNYYVLDGVAQSEGARVFVRENAAKLMDLARPRYFRVSVVPLETMIAYLDGWYAAESNAEESWRWMGKSSLTRLPALDGTGRLTLGFHVPLDSVPRPPALTVTWNGNVVHQQRCTSTDTNVVLDLPSAPQANELRLTVDVAMNPSKLTGSKDTRDLGLMLRRIAWNKVR
ncbi:MAG TPA: hypothetical protein VF698_14910 [Thermoanaerobaculia bacterium]